MAALGPETLSEVGTVAALELAAFRFPDPLWVRVVYDFALAYHRRRLTGDQLLRSLVPLYLGRTAAFVIGTAGKDVEDVERAIRDLANEYLKQKSYVAERWGEP